LSSLSSWSWNQTRPPEWDVESLPPVPDDLVIKDWVDIAKGTHGVIRKVRVERNNSETYLCFKLFTDEWSEEYEREALAYEIMQFRGVEDCIPTVYFKGSHPTSRWEGREASTEVDPILHGLVMEFFENCREIQWSQVKVSMALHIARALRNIHKAHIIHGDMDESNLLVVREADKIRPVWIDFSCARIKAYPEQIEQIYRGFVGRMINDIVTSTFPLKLITEHGLHK
jgi:serine/threonine protein kinase